MTGYLVGWFLIVMLETREFPALVGPYTSKAVCMDVEEVYQLRGYETGGCTIMNIPAEIEPPPL